MSSNLEQQPIRAFRTNAPSRGEWVGWLPLCFLPLISFSTRGFIPSWVFMWLLAFSIYVGLKWLTWWQARNNSVHPTWYSAAYLLGWPGMDADSFFRVTADVAHPRPAEWLWAALKTTTGVALIWFVARTIPGRLMLIRGWIGMLGLILLLHFGIFHLLALLWRSCGVHADEIMRSPLKSQSLSEFWGRRWNLGFRQLSHELIFRPLVGRMGPRLAGFLVFVFSGLLHDLVISVPAGGGYGLPTLYFTIQGLGTAVEHSSAGKKLRVRRGLRGWLFMAAVTALPVFWLFHPPFVKHVIIPFMYAIRAL